MIYVREKGLVTSYEIKACYIEDDIFSYLLSFFVFVSWIVWVSANTPSVVKKDATIYLITNIHTSVIWFLLWCVSWFFSVDRPKASAECDCSPAFPDAMFVSTMSFMMHILFAVFFYRLQSGISVKVCTIVAMIGYPWAILSNMYMSLWEWAANLALSFFFFMWSIVLFHYLFLPYIDYLSKSRLGYWLGIKNYLFKKK